MNTPLLSVTTTNYNYARYIRRTIESVLNQIFTDFEYIIVDDASSDESAEIIQEYAARDNRIRFFRHASNCGFTKSLSETCELARGRYRVHIDADDWIIDQGAFGRQIALLEQDAEVAFVFSPVVMFTDDRDEAFTSSAYDQDTVQLGEQAIEKILSFSVAHSGPMIRMSSYEACGGYDSNFRYALDLKLWVDLCGQGKVGYVNQPLYAYRQHSDNMTATTKRRLHLDETMRSIDASFDGPLADRIQGGAATRRRVTSKALLHGPTHAIFSGNYRAGWQNYWISLIHFPRETLLQWQTLSLIARTILGARGYALLNNLRP